MRCHIVNIGYMLLHGQKQLLSLPDFAPFERWLLFIACTSGCFDLAPPSFSLQVHFKDTMRDCTVMMSVQHMLLTAGVQWRWLEVWSQI